MSRFASYTSVALPTPGKKGILKKLDNDYFEIVVGAFGAYANGGWIYDEKSSIDFFENNPDFLAMLRNRKLRSEWGHPRRQVGMTDLEWLQRIHEIYEPNWSSHIRALHLSHDTVKDKDGRSVIAIIGEVTPCGPHADNFRRCLENPDEDMNYSVRSFARKNFATGRKHFTKVITFDSVYDPGIAEASKFTTPSLESKDISDSSYVSDILDSAEFHIEDLKRSVESGSVDLSSFESKDDVFKLIDSVTYAEEAKSFGRQYYW